MKKIIKKIKRFTSEDFKKTLDKLFPWLSIAAVLLIAFMSYSLQRLYTHNELAAKISKIVNINEAIDNHINSEFSIIQTDLINEHLRQIDNLIDEISKNSDYTSFFNTPSSHKSFKELVDNIKANEVVLNKFVTHKAVIMEKTLDLSATLRKTKEIRTLAGFFSRILLSRFGEIFDANLFSDDVRAYRYEISNSEEEGSQIDYNYSLLLSQLNEEIIQLIGIQERREQVSDLISASATELTEKLNNYSRSTKNLLNVILLFVATLMIIFMIKLRFNQQAKLKMREKELQIKEILEHSSDTVFEIDTKGVIKSVNYSKNKNKYPLIGTVLELMSPDGRPINIIAELESKDKYSLNEIRRKKLRENADEPDIPILEETLNQDVIITKEDESGYNFEYHERMYASPIRKLGKIIGANVILIDFTKQLEAEYKQKKYAEKLEIYQHVDKETGLPNHLALSKDLNNSRENGLRKYVVYISIDQFENFQFFYNDRTVSLILIEVSRTIRLCMRNYDIKTELYRLQEDKFCLVCEEEDKDRLAERLLNYFSSTIVLKDDLNHDITLNISLRLGFSNDTDTDSSDRLAQAKLAHQKARQIEAPYFIYEQNDENERTYRHNQIVSSMIRYALNNNKITAECQPIYDLTKPLPGENNYELFSYEILVRLYDDEGKIHYPGEFLGVAKQAGLYISITKAVINIAFDLVEKFDYVFSINLSSADMANTSVRELFNARLKKCKAPNRLTIEVLETEDIDQKMDDVLKFLNNVRNQGCHVAIDDFGSGFANIATILQLNIDYIKIDGSIIKRLPHDENSRAFLNMLSNFAASANYTMVAEFVSSQDILDQVKTLGIQYAQGYLLGKPAKLV
ncbi:EAL domain-containing protein [Campylobacter sp.]|uniref:EAL domain-containing protein n=1 Tax=Campylobacter sp. TaxID=205 RepID=UPI002AA7A6E9|nr:EAL domain-containing protein [Campylobacter sp.]MCI7075867.1 EAL domain-containing protein [Campylobacter sp.]